MPKLIDLSHPLEHGQLAFPRHPRPTVVESGTIATMGYNITQLGTSTHQGTHLDVPYHFLADGKTVDQVPLERFFGPAVLVDLAPGGALEPKTPITVAMLRLHEAKFHPRAKVLYRTGWYRTFGREEYFTQYPTLTVEAAQWIADRRIGLLGMDTPTPSVQGQECHRILMGPGVEIILVEGLTNLDRLPGRFTFIGFPLSLTGRDGSPIRAVAVVE